MRSVMALGLILATAATAHAGWLNRLGRHLGLGWSDGYHAFDQCPPSGGQTFAIPPGGLVPTGPSFIPDAQPTPAMPHPEMLPPPQAAAGRPSHSVTPHPVIPLLR